MNIRSIESHNRSDFIRQKLEELEKDIPDVKDLPLSFSWKSQFFQGSAEKEVAQKFGKTIHSMASYLALSKTATETIAKIRDVGKILANNRIAFTEEDRALLERVRLAVFLREQPERIDVVRKNLSTYFRSKLNKQLFEKWIKEGFPDEAFFYNPTVPSFIFTTHLHHVVKQYGDSFEYDKETHEFKILVDGVFQNVAEIAATITIQEEERLGSTIISLVDKEKQKKTYLPQRGLCTWDNERWTKLKPFAHLTEAQVAFAQQSARRQDGSAGQKGDYVVEIVSSIMEYKEFPLLSGYQDTFNKFRHPWIRIITPEGEFYSVGFNIGQDLVPGQPTAFVKGLFRSPDSWETLSFSKRPITGFAVSKEVCDKIIHEVEVYQKKKTPFNIVEKNCTAFIQRVKEILHPNKKDHIDFAVDISELFQRCLPKTLQNIGKKIAPISAVITYWVGEFFPPVVLKVSRACGAFFRLMLERTVIAFSGRWFSYGKGDSFERSIDPHKGIPWYKFITHINIALDERLVRLYLPRKLGEWQLSLPQTRIMGKDTPLFDQYQPAQSTVVLS